MPDVLRTIQLLVAPVVMISACGLLSLALYNRLVAIVSRARVFNKESFEETAKLAAAEGELAGNPALAQLRRRVAIVDEQATQILRRARLVRDALMCLLAAILCMLLCSLALGLSLLRAWFAGVALSLFALGILITAAGVVLCLAEVRHALDQAELERSTSG